MAKTVTYTGMCGPGTVSFGALGQFTKGEPRTIDDDDQADQLLAKGYFEESPLPVYPEPDTVPTEPVVAGGTRRGKTSPIIEQEG